MSALVSCINSATRSVPTSMSAPVVPGPIRHVRVDLMDSSMLHGGVPSRPTPSHLHPKGYYSMAHDATAPANGNEGIDFQALFDMAVAERSMSEDDVARLLGVTQATVNRWRTGRLIPSHDSAPTVARFLGVRLAVLEAMLDRSHDSHDDVEPGTFGALLRELEAKRRLSPVEMIDKYGMERSRYYRWRGNLTVPKPEHIKGLAKQLKVPEEEIVLACYRTAIGRGQ